MKSATPVAAGPRSLDASAPAPVPRGPVLLATDGRGAGNSPAIAARLLADHIGVGVEVVAVMPPRRLRLVRREGAPSLLRDLEDNRRADLEAAVCRRLEPVLGLQAHWALHLRAGAPGRVIADVARERRASMIVVGAAARLAPDATRAEDVALQVVRCAIAPVLSVAPRPTGAPRRVVVGMDFSASSIRAAQSALALLDGAGDDAVLSLVHVLPTLADWTRDSDAIAGMFAQLEELLRPAVPGGCRLETHVRIGEVVASLRQAVAEDDADVLAVGTHGADWVERSSVGRVASSTLCCQEVTVLVAPRPRAAPRPRVLPSARVELDRTTDSTGALEILTRRNAGRLARLEVDDPTRHGVVVEADECRFQFATYDQQAHRVDIVLRSDLEPLRRLTHSIPGVQSIEIFTRSAERDERLLVVGDRGETVLTFLR